MRFVGWCTWRFFHPSHSNKSSFSSIKNKFSSFNSLRTKAETAPTANNNVPPCDDAIIVLMKTFSSAIILHVNVNVFWSFPPFLHRLWIDEPICTRMHDVKKCFRGRGCRKRLTLKVAKRIYWFDFGMVLTRRCNKTNTVERMFCLCNFIWSILECLSCVIFVPRFGMKFVHV